MFILPPTAQSFDKEISASVLAIKLSFKMFILLHNRHYLGILQTFTLLRKYFKVRWKEKDLSENYQLDEISKKNNFYANSR